MFIFLVLTVNVLNFRVFIFHESFLSTKTKEMVGDEVDVVDPESL